MSHRKSLLPVVLTTTLLLLSLTSTIPRGFASTKTRRVYLLDYRGLTVEIEAPCTANPGENINITISAETGKNVDDAHITVNIYGLRNRTDEITLGETINFTLQSEDTYKNGYEIPVYNDVSPGLTYGKIECNWTFRTTVTFEEVEIMVSIPECVHSNFPVTYVENEEFMQLQKEYRQLNESYSSVTSKYASLNVTYHDLMSNYTTLNTTLNELESKYAASAGEIAGVRNLMYVFVVTTIIAASSAVFIGIRRRKTGINF